jgi:hypothetical protein
MGTNSKRRDAYLKEREAGFDLDFGVRSKLPEYNSLLDSNMRHYFESESVQSHLLQTGQIDEFGRIINLEKHRSRLHVIENEFHRAEQREEWMRKDEERARHLVRCKRFTEIETQRDHEKVDRRREGKRLQLELDKAEQ